MPKYPAQIDTSQSLPTAVDNLTPVSGSVFNRLRDAVLAIETELGVKPSGNYSNVAARLNTLEGIVGNLKIIEIQEDLGGTIESPLVIGFQGRPVSSAAPSFGQTLVWNGIAWSPSNIIGGQGTLFQDLMIPPLTVDLEGTTIVEVGQTLTNPAFTASYFFFPSTLIPPQQALFADSENAGAVDVSGTPNSFSSTHSFSHNTFGAEVVFTLTAHIDAVTKTGTLNLVWGQLLYWGTGPAAQSGASFITGLTGQALTTTKDFAFSINAGATDKIYFACRSAYGDVVFTVHDVEGGFVKTGTFMVTNGHGFSENYDLYESDNVNLGSIIVITGEGDDEFIGGGGPVGPSGPPGLPGPPGPSGGGDVIFDGGTTSKNVRTDRPANQSPIDNTKDGIVNFSTDTTNATTGATGNYTAILSGDQNVVSGDYSIIGGGLGHIITGDHGFIGGGLTNTVTDGVSGIGSGHNNIVHVGPGFIGGGFGNSIGGDSCFIGGGESNQANQTDACVVGGSTNLATGTRSFIGGGSSNTAAGTNSVISGGDQNTTNSNFNTISGGVLNSTTGDNSTIVGGSGNTTTGDDAVVGGLGSSATTFSVAFGRHDHANGVDAVAIGANSIADGQGSVVISYGGHATSTATFGAFVSGQAPATATMDGERVHGFSSSPLVEHKVGMTNISTNGASANLVTNGGPDLTFISFSGSTSVIIKMHLEVMGARTDAAGQAWWGWDILGHLDNSGNFVIDFLNTRSGETNLNGQTWTVVPGALGASLHIVATGTLGQNVLFAAKASWIETAGF